MPEILNDGAEQALGSVTLLRMIVDQCPTRFLVLEDTPEAGSGTVYPLPVGRQDQS